jgi:hypothetical protein
MVRLRYRLVPKSLVVLVSLAMLMFIVYETHCCPAEQI